MLYMIVLLNMVMCLWFIGSIYAIIIDAALVVQALLKEL